MTYIKRPEHPHTVMYIEMKEALVGDSDNWTHEELIERALELVDTAREGC